MAKPYVVGVGDGTVIYSVAKFLHAVTMSLFAAVWLNFYARELARISYGNSVLMSVRPGVTSRYRCKTR